MAPKTNTQTSTRTNVKSERFELAKSISNICTKMESFNNSVNDLNTYSKDILNKIDLDISTKKIELSEIENNIQHSIKNSKIEIDLYLREYKRDASIEILTELDETVITNKKFNELNDELTHFRQEYKKDLDIIIKENVDKRDKAIGSAIKNMELKHKADNAALIAESSQKDREIENLRSNIQDLRKEVEAQRELTKSVASSSSHGYMQYQQKI